MKVIYFNNNVISVINDDKNINGVYVGTFEPIPLASTVSFDLYDKYKIIDGIKTDLTSEEELMITAYIEKFDFESFNVASDIKLVGHGHAVSTEGYYLGYVNLAGINETQVVNSKPEDPNKYFWDFDLKDWVLGFTVNKDTGALVHDGVVRYDTVYAYIDRSLVNTDACTQSQTYDFIAKTVVVNLSIAKQRKNASLHQSMMADINSTASEVGGFGAYEVSSFYIQYAEAKEYTIDLDLDSHPFLSRLYKRRQAEGFIDTIEELVNKIIAKYPIFCDIHADTVGYYHGLVKKLETATSLDEIVSITWDYKPMAE